jgi:hypothetical protein
LGLQSLLPAGARTGANPARSAASRPSRTARTGPGTTRASNSWGCRVVRPMRWRAPGSHGQSCTATKSGPVPYPEVCPTSSISRSHNDPYWSENIHGHSVTPALRMFSSSSAARCGLVADACAVHVLHSLSLESRISSGTLNVEHGGQCIHTQATRNRTRELVRRLRLYDGGYGD